MDVYIGFGLLSAGIVVLVFMLLDGWLKKRDAKMAEISSMSDKTLEEPEFTIPVSHNEFTEVHGNFEDQLQPSLIQHPFYDDEIANEKPVSGLTEFCENDFSVEPLPEESIEMPVEEEDHFPVAATVAPEKNKLQSDSRLKKVFFTPPNLLVLSVMAKRDTLF